jgi:hypothetical protein
LDFEFVQFLRCGADFLSQSLNRCFDVCFTFLGEMLPNVLHHLHMRAITSDFVPEARAAQCTAFGQEVVSVPRVQLLSVRMIPRFVSEECELSEESVLCRCSLSREL